MYNVLRVKRCKGFGDPLSIEIPFLNRSFQIQNLSSSQLSSTAC